MSSFYLNHRISVPDLSQVSPVSVAVLGSPSLVLLLASDSYCSCLGLVRFYWVPQLRE